MNSPQQVLDTVRQAILVAASPTASSGYRREAAALLDQVLPLSSVVTQMRWLCRAIARTARSNVIRSWLKARKHSSFRTFLFLHTVMCLSLLRRLCSWLSSGLAYHGQQQRDASISGGQSAVTQCTGEGRRSACCCRASKLAGGSRRARSAAFRVPSSSAHGAGSLHQPVSC